MATLLVVYGDIINKQVKRSLSGLHFILRSGLFVLLCAFGYGALTLYGAPLLHHIFKFVAYEYRGVAFIVAFVALGVAAERRRYIWQGGYDEGISCQIRIKDKQVNLVCQRDNAAAKE